METSSKRISYDPLGEDRKRIYCRLVNPALYRERLRTMPNEPVLDMVLVYFLRMDFKNEESMSMLITDYHLYKWGLSKEELKQLALENTMRDYDAVFQTLDEILERYDIPRETSERKTMYVLSNEERQNGAVCMIYPGCLETIAEELGGDFYVIPSSVHECLIVQCDGDLEPGRIRRIIRFVNETEVQRQDVLSGSLYRFYKSDHTLMIDNS